MGNESSTSQQTQQPINNNLSVNWNEVLPKDSNTVMAVDGHSATENSSGVYIFGGVRFCEAIGAESNLLFKFSEGSWSPVSVSGVVPPARSAASLVSVGKYLYLIGGVNQVTGWLNDVHRFDTEANAWELIHPSGEIPSPRDKAACATIGEKIYMFGGFGPQNVEDDEEEDEEWESEEEEEEQEAAQFGWFKDLFVLDTANHQWSRPMQMNLCGPTPRAACTMCAIGNTLIVFGGKDAEGRTNDLHFFNTTNWKWEPRSVRGQAPAGRSFHSMCRVSDKRLCVFGGRAADNNHLNDLHVLDAEVGAWMEVTPSVGAAWPAARGLHSLTSYGQQLVLHGGSSDLDPETMECRNFYSDTWTLSLEDLRLGGASEENPVPAVLSDDKENSEKRPSTPPKQPTIVEDVSPPKIRKTENL